MENFIHTFLYKSSDLPSTLGMIGIAFLTILIPIAVAIFSDKKDFEILDRNVILDHVVNARYFLIYIALIYVPILLWESSSHDFHFFEFFAWATGICLIAVILRKSYHWMKGNKFILRFGYLRKLNNPKDMEESWRSVWEEKNINTQNEKEFFAIFSSAVDNFLKNND